MSACSYVRRRLRDGEARRGERRGADETQRRRADDGTPSHDVGVAGVALGQVARPLTARRGERRGADETGTHGSARRLAAVAARYLPLLVGSESARQMLAEGFGHPTTQDVIQPGAEIMNERVPNAVKSTTETAPTDASANRTG